MKSRQLQPHTEDIKPKLVQFRVIKYNSPVINTTFVKMMLNFVCCFNWTQSHLFFKLSLAVLLYDDTVRLNQPFIT